MTWREAGYPSPDYPAVAEILEYTDDLVQARYKLPAPAGPTAVAVKIVDMPGEEVLVTATI